MAIRQSWICASGKSPPASATAVRSIQLARIGSEGRYELACWYSDIGVGRKGFHRATPTAAARTSVRNTRHQSRSDGRKSTGITTAALLRLFTGIKVLSLAVGN